MLSMLGMDPGLRRDDGLAVPLRHVAAAFITKTGPRSC